MNRTSIPPTRRTTPSQRARAVAIGTVAATVAMISLAACSSGDGSDGANKTSTTSTTPGSTTTLLAPLVKGAKTYGLAYLSSVDSTTTVFLTTGTGSKTSVVARLEGRAEALRWSPDGQRLLLDGDSAGDFELQVVDVKDGTVTVLAPSPSSNEGGASWSPDGTEVAFFSNRNGGFAGYVVPAAGGEAVRVTPPEAEAVADLAWSPDGSQLAFSTSSNANSDVWVVDADGSSPKKVSTVPGSTQPVWSPDGKLLAISAQPLGAETSGIFTLDPATGESTEVANTAYRDAFPVWAPDGESIYFVSAMPNDEVDGGSADDIFRVDLNGGEPESVIADPISVESELSFTADGKLLAFSVQRLGDKEIFVANADGSGAIPVSRSERSDAFGTWRPGSGPDAE